MSDAPDVVNVAWQAVYTCGHKIIGSCGGPECPFNDGGTLVISRSLVYRDDWHIAMDENARLREALEEIVDTDPSDFGGEHPANACWQDMADIARHALNREETQ